ncbi:MAG: hypothetical protein AAFO89_12005 [Planctomycetota bacterium]
MPELDEGGRGGGLVQGGGNGGGGGGGGGGSAPGGGEVEGPDAAQTFEGGGDAAASALQDDADRDCGALAEALAEENEVLRVRVAELEAALAGVERRFELERSLADAGVIDLETAMAVAEVRVDAGDTPAAIVSELVASKPFLFRGPRSSARGSALGGASVAAESSLSGLADEARRSGDRRALTRYLRKRRQG